MRVKTMTTEQVPTPPPPSRLLVELGPLGLFFAANYVKGIYWGTGVFMAAITAALLYSWKRDHRVPPMTVFTAVLVLVFGGLTIALHDDTFIKVKVTLINVLFAAVLTVGLLTGRMLLQTAFGHAFQITERGWKLMSIRWIAFFLVLAALNELVWRNTTTDTWVTYKVFGQLALSFGFVILQVPLLQRHALAPEPEGPAEG